MEKLITIIMSTYNTDEKYLKDSIDSVLNQSYSNIELIIVCDGNKSEYDFLKNTYNDKRIVLILHDKNEGLPASLNEGIKIAKGAYIARMDSDDICMEDRFKTQVDFLDKNKNVEICGMYAKYFGEMTNKTCYKFIKPDEIEVQMLYIPVLIHPTVMFRREFFDKDLFYNTEFECSQDYELWARAVNNENIAIIPKIGLKYRIHKSQAGQKKKEKQIKNTRKIHKYGLKKININNEEQTLRCFEVLYGLTELNKDNFIEIAEIIDEIIEKNIYFDELILKKILYNRYMILMVKSKLICQMLNRKTWKKIFNFENLKYIIWKIMH